MMQDNRLEAIAGSPMVLTDTPTNHLSEISGMSFIFVGQIAPYNPDTSTSSLQSTISHANPDRYAYWRADLTFLANIGPRQVLDGYVTVQSLDAHATGGWSLGRHRNLATHSTWAGKMLAAAYDRVLTPQQAEDVTRRLLRHLKEAPPPVVRKFFVALAGSWRHEGGGRGQQDIPAAAVILAARPRGRAHRGRNRAARKRGSVLAAHQGSGMGEWSQVGAVTRAVGAFMAKCATASHDGGQLQRVRVERCILQLEPAERWAGSGRCAGGFHPAQGSVSCQLPRRATSRREVYLHPVGGAS